MKIAILAAMQKELELLLSLLDTPSEMEYEGVSLHKGTLGTHEVYIAKCGIGKVNSALAAYKVIKTVEPDLVINSGVAGGAGVPIGTLLIADRVAYCDVWCGPGTEYGEADGYPLFMSPSSRFLDLARRVAKDGNTRFGLICSGDKFISSADEIAFIRSHFPEVDAVDMESASIAQTCISCGVPFGVVRVVSDTPGEGENIEQYTNFWNDAPMRTFSAVHTIIESL